MLIGVAVSALFLWMAARNVEWSRLVDELGRVRAVPFAIGAVLALGALIANAYRWRLLLGETARVTVADAFDFMAIGYISGLVMPQRLGDIVKVVMLARRGGASRTSVLGTVVVERLTDIIMLLVLAAIFVLTVRLSVLLQMSLIVVALAAAATVLVIRYHRTLSPPLFSLARKVAPGRIIDVVEAQVEKLAAGLEVARDGRGFATAMLLAALAWVLSGISMGAYVSAFNLPVSWYAGFLVILLTNLGGILPSSPGSIGVYHYMTILALGTWSVDQTSAMSFAIVTHAMTMLLIMVTGFWALTRQGLSLRSVRDGAVS